MCFAHSSVALTVQGDGWWGHSRVLWHHNTFGANHGPSCEHYAKGIFLDSIIPLKKHIYISLMHSTVITFWWSIVKWLVVMHCFSSLSYTDEWVPCKVPAANPVMSALHAGWLCRIWSCNPPQTELLPTKTTVLLWVSPNYYNKHANPCR